MIFETIPVGEIAGSVLAHSIRAKDAVFKKGRHLSEGDVEHLKAAGVRDVTVARLEEGDIPEDEAADMVAKAIAGPHVIVHEPFTGRANLYGTSPGLIVINEQAVNRLNAIHESVTMATLASFDLVAERQMLATIKIIPFAVDKGILERVLAIAKSEDPLVRVAPFQSKKVGLVFTELSGTKISVLEKTRQIIESRIEALGCSLNHHVRSGHQPDAIATAIRACLDAGSDLVLIFGASAIVDRRDAIPQGIVETGGKIRHFGMPVDPGNLLLLGEVDDLPIVGLPGCARSPKINGLDWVLRRLVADIDVGPKEIAAMGVGGLLKEIPSRPQPRNSKSQMPKSDVPSSPKIAAVILAAGQSQRMGKSNKLLAELDGVPMIRRVTEIVMASQNDKTIVVTGHEGNLVRKALSGFRVTFADNPKFEEGLSTSLRAGIGLLDPDVDAVIICLGDMPGVSSKHINKLIAAFDPEEGRAICVPTHKGKRGNPVLWGRQLFEQLGQVTGDAGARHLIAENLELVCEVAVSDGPGILEDLDTPEALDAYRRKI